MRLLYSVTIIIVIITVLLFLLPLETLKLLNDKTSSFSILVITCSIVFAFFSYESSRESRRRKLLSSSASLSYDGWINIEKMVATDPYLRRYWFKLIGIHKFNVLINTPVRDGEIGEKRMILIDIMIQIAENVFLVENLREVKEDSSDIRLGWVNAFKRMFSDTEFFSVYEFSRDNYTTDFKRYVYDDLLKIKETPKPKYLYIKKKDDDVEIVPVR